MEKKKFLSDVLFIQGINILIKAVWILLIDRAVQNELPTSVYGQYFSLFSFTVLFIILLDFGLNNMNSREVAANPAYLQQNFLSFVITKAVLSVVFAFTVIIAGLVLSLSGAEWSILSMLIVMQIFISFNAYFRSNLAALHRFKLDGMLSVTDRLLVIIICGSWFLVPGWKHNLTIQNFVLVQVGGTLLTLTIALIINIRSLNNPNQDFQFDEIKRLIRSALPFALLAALMAVFTRIDAVMLSEMIGSEAADIYAMGYRLLDAGNMVAVLLAGMLLPMFARMISEKASKSLSELALLSAKLLILPAILIAIISWVYPVEILSFMYPNKIDIISPDTFRYLMISFIATCSIYVFGTALTAAKELKWLNILATTTLVSNLVLNAILIPTHGSDGAALATLLTQAVFALGCFYKAKTSFNIHITSKLTLSISIYTGLLIGLFWLGRQFFETPFVHISVGVVCAVVFVFASGLFNLNMLKSLVRRKTRNS